MVLVAIFSETGFFDYCAVKVSDESRSTDTKSKKMEKEKKKIKSGLLDIKVCSTLDSVCIFLFSNILIYQNL